MWKAGKFGFENNVPEGSGLYGGEKKVSDEEDTEEKDGSETPKKGNFYKEKEVEDEATK